MSEIINGVPIGDLPGIESVPDDSMLVVEFLGKAYHMPGAVLRQMIQDVLDSMGDSVDDVTEARLTAAIETVLASGKYNGVSPLVEVLDEEDGTSVIHIIDAFGVKEYPVEVKGARNAVQYVEQELTDEQKAQARKNIGVGDGTGTADAVQYVPQTLTTEQQTQARNNIGISDYVSSIWIIVNPNLDLTSQHIDLQWYINGWDGDFAHFEFDVPYSAYELARRNGYTKDEVTFYKEMSSNLGNPKGDSLKIDSDTGTLMLLSANEPIGDGVTIPVFVGKYDTVTFTEIKTAHDAGRVCFLDFNGISLPLLGVNDTEAMFVREINENTDYRVTITSDGGKDFTIVDKNISDVYVVRLFSAKYAEVKAAYEAGKACFVTYGALLCPLTVLDEEKAEFVGMLTPNMGIKGIVPAEGTIDWTYVRSNAVQTVEQSLTDAQKAQARTNIGAAAAADIAATKYASTSQAATSYFKISDFGSWGTGAWYQKGFSMLITSRAGETVWFSLSANDSGTTARAFRLMNTYTKIAGVYYSVTENAVYVKAAGWCNNVTAHILSNIGGDYVPTVSVVSGLGSDVVEVPIVEFGPTSSGLAVGDSSTALLLGGSATRPTYNGADMALLSDIPDDFFIGSYSTVTYSEISAAVNAGKHCFVFYTMLYGLCHLTALTEEYAQFLGVIQYGNAIRLRIKSDGTREYEQLKLNAVQYAAQSLTDAQKAQARSNIGAVGYTAPANVAGTEQVTAKLYTSNGGSIAFGKEGPNSGTMIRLDQTDGTCRLRFRASATAGAMVWEQPEQGAQLYVDLGKEGVDKHRITFPSSAGTLALTSQIPSLSGYLPLSGGLMTGPLKFQAASLPGKSLQYICGIDAFASGGEMGWQSKADFLSGYLTTTGTAARATADANGNNIANTYANKNAGNTFNGEQRMVNSSYAPNMNDIASGVGCSLKNARACDNQLIVAEIYAPTTAATDSTINMNAVVGEIGFYHGGSGSGGQFTGKTQLARITSAGIYEGSTLLANKYLAKSGGTMTGALNLKNSTWNLAGDDAYFGDNDTAGSFAIKGANGTTNLKMVTYNGTTYGTLSWNGSNFVFSNGLNFPGGTVSGKLIATGGVDIRGAASTQPLKVRGIVGSDGNGTVAELYLQYGASKALMLGNTGAYNISADGSTYSGTSARATADGNGNNIVNTYDKKTVRVNYDTTNQTVDKTVSEIKAAWDAGQNVCLTDGTSVYPLNYVDASEVIFSGFSINANSKFFFDSVHINSSGKVRYYSYSNQ